MKKTRAALVTVILALTFIPALAKAQTMVLLGTTTASSSASIAFTSIPSGYSEYQLVLTNVIPATNSVTPYIRVSENNGSTWLSGSTAYNYAGFSSNYGGGTGAGGSPGAAQAAISNFNVSNSSTGGGISGVVHLYGLPSTAVNKQFAAHIVASDGGVGSGAIQTQSIETGGYTADQGAVNGVQFFFSSGNIASGTFSLYGISTTASGDTPAGSDQQVQFNEAGSFGADSNFNWDYTTHGLGLGTSSPTNTLDIANGGGIHIASGVPGSTSMALYNNSGTLTWNGAVLGTGSSVSGTTNYIPVFTASNALGNSVVYQSGGDIGIGTTSPANPLDIVGGAIFRSAAPNIPSSGVGNYLHIGYDSANAWGYIASRTNGLVGEPLHIDGTTLVLNQNTNSGNVGIKTASPSYTLQVAGSVAGTSAYVNTSDVRLKKDIQPISYGLQAIMKLKPVSFNWVTQDQEWKKKHQIGLIAQDVETVIPEVVYTADDKLKTKGLAYGSLIPVLIQSIKEMKSDNDAQAKQIEKLRHDFEEYKRVHP